MEEFVDLIKVFKVYEKEQKTLKTKFRKDLKGLINITGLYNYLDELGDWEPIGIVEIQITDEKMDGYEGYQFARVIGKDPNLYMKQRSEIRSIDHSYVWQTVGYLGDDYSGFSLYPLNNGKYFKISYRC